MGRDVLRRNVQLFTYHSSRENRVDGYNCKAKVWVGNEEVRAFFDTGAIRNTIDFAVSVGLKLSNGGHRSIRFVFCRVDRCVHLCVFGCGFRPNIIHHCLRVVVGVLRLRDYVVNLAGQLRTLLCGGLLRGRQLPLEVVLCRGCRLRVLRFSLLDLGSK